MGIRGRLLALTMGVAIPLAVTGLLGLEWLWTVSRDQLDVSVRKQSELGAAAFERWIEAERQPLIALAASESGRPDSQPLTSEELRSVVRAHPNWLAVEAFDGDGRPMVAFPASPPRLSPEIASSLGASLARGEPSALEVDWSAPRRPILVIAAPLDDGGQLFARVDASSISDVIRQIELPPGGVITFLDPGYRILLRSPNGAEFVGRDMSDTPVVDVLRTHRSTVNEVTSRNDGVVRVYGLARVGSTGFVTSVGVPSAELHEPARAQFDRYLLFSLVALASAAAASVFIARKIAAPVRHLSEVAHDLGGGDFTVRARDLGDGEMAELSRVFNVMAASLEERDAKLAEIDRLKSEFVSSVSHELRTPLTTIKTLTQVLRQGGETPDERARFLDAIAAECDRQIHFVLDLLDLSRIEAGGFTITAECVDPAEVIESLVSIERVAVEASGHDLVSDLESDLPYVWAERAALRRVLRCLIENAVKYTPRGGRITVSARAAEDSVALAVADTGPGIAPEDLPHLFEKFYRSTGGSGAEPHGVGLGLFLARTIVEHFGGALSVESVPGRGSTFSIALPRWTAGPALPDVSEEKVNEEASADRR